MRRSCALFASGFVSLLVLPLSAQQPAPATKIAAGKVLPGDNHSYRDNVGLHRVDGDLWGGGNQYKARFDAGGVQFTPALPTAPRNLPVDLKVTGYGRGAPSMPVTAVAPTHEALLVTYARPEFVETYAVANAGLKQSFTFASLPPGDGDLIVRCELRTELQPEFVGTTLHLRAPGIGEMSIRDVVGIDADGRRFGGSMRWDGRGLDLVLPAEEVAKSRLPLQLDPVIGGTINVQTSADDDFDPDVAYDATAGVYLVVFRRNFSSTDHDVHGQMVNGDGSLRGGRLFIENSVAFEWHGRVANVSLEDTFVVVYTRQDNAGGDNVMGRAVRATDSSIGAATFLADSPSFFYYPEVGGEATNDDNDAVCVFYDGSADELRAMQVSVFGSVTPPVLSAGSHLPVSGGPSTTWSESEPAIAKSGGRTGNFVIAWSRTFTSGGSQIRAVVINRNVGILNTLIPVTNDTLDNDAPEVDGDGENWLIAWERETSAGTLLNDILVRPLSHRSTDSGPTAAATVLASSTANETDPAVGWLGNSALVSYTYDFSFPDNDAYLVHVDPFTCANCEGFGNIDSSFDQDDTIVLASEFSGGAFNADGALICYRKRDIDPAPGTGISDIQGRRYRADDGDTSDLGGGCGNGGSAVNTCMRTGNSAFAFRLRSAAPSAGAVLMLSSAYSGRACGTCTLVPDPWLGTAAVAPATDTVGDTAVNLAIPASSALAGYGLYVQFAVTGTACFSGFDLSNGIFASIN
ncbi:MAG: hypothetical protein IPK26_16185 [Planctomycetes bacterium]|nr:hypothetical protein [Planctomycetota bacterium]